MRPPYHAYARGRERAVGRGAPVACAHYGCGYLPRYLMKFMPLSA